MIIENLIGNRSRSSFVGRQIISPQKDKNNMEHKRDEKKSKQENAKKRFK